MKKVYVAAPFADAEMVRGIHKRMGGLGLMPMSGWAETAGSQHEDLSAYTPDQLNSFALMNDADLLCADFVLVLARAGAGGEMFAEARLAIERNIPVVWVGRHILSAWRDGVTRVANVDAALTLMARA